MYAMGYSELRKHTGHAVEVTVYEETENGQPVAAIECIDCEEVLFEISGDGESGYIIEDDIAEEDDIEDEFIPEEADADGFS